MSYFPLTITTPLQRVCDSAEIFLQHFCFACNCDLEASQHQTSTQTHVNIITIISADIFQSHRGKLKLTNSTTKSGRRTLYT